MPSVYAHYRFGSAMLETMPADIRRTVRRFRRLYDVGLHGPDPLFYSRPLFEGRLALAAEKVHKQTGREFFTRNCRILRLEPSEAGTAYLYGVLCHYCLDTCCREAFAQTAHKHDLEKAFDRLLLQKDGKDGLLDYSRHLKLSAGEYATAAKCYPGITASQFRAALQCMAYATRLVATPESQVNKLARKITAVFRKSHKGADNDPSYLSRLPQLEAAYAQAETIFPQMLEQLTAHLTYNAAFKESFSQPFSE